MTPDIDAVVHAGAPLGDWAADTKAVTALLDRIRPGGAFVYVSGTWVVGPSDGGSSSTNGRRRGPSTSSRVAKPSSTPSCPATHEGLS